MRVVQVEEAHSTGFCTINARTRKKTVLSPLRGRGGGTIKDEKAQGEYQQERTKEGQSETMSVCEGKEEYSTGWRRRERERKRERIMQNRDAEDNGDYFIL